MTLSTLARRRWRIALALSLLVVALYFGFILLIAFDKPLMARTLGPGLSVGILCGALLIVAAWLTTFVYVRWANRHFDRRVQELRAAEGAR